MIKNALIALASLVFSFFMAGVVVTHAQTPTVMPTVTNTTTNSTSNETTNTTVTPRVPSSAPDTGFGGSAK